MLAGFLQPPLSRVDCRSLFYGAVEKIRQRRSRHFSVLTYWKYALREKMTAAFPSRSLRTGLEQLF
jgi:hypothetical protein